MSLLVQRLCLALMLLTAAGGHAGAVSGPADQPEPPPAPLASQPDPADQPEPPPAPLEVRPDPADLPEPAPAPLLTTDSPAPISLRPATPGRASRNTALVGVGVTLALLTTGTVFGVLAQQRSDSLSRSTTQLIDGLAPIYDASQRAAFTDLQSQGQTYNSVTIACFLAGGATALTSAILFWNAGRLAGRDKSLALVPALFPSGGTVTVMGRF